MDFDTALRRYQAGEAERADLKLLVKQLLKLLVAKAPGHAVEVRVPPYGAVQCIEGPRHTRGTPGAVVEMPPELWIDLGLGRITWPEARDSGKLRASGERTDLSALLPLVEDYLPPVPEDQTGVRPE
ncbi:sterol carrier family protein [Kribbella endophytica]